VPINFEKLVPLKNVAEKLGVTAAAVRMNKARGILPSWIFVKIGCRLYVDTGRFNQWLNQREVKGQRAADRIRERLVG